MESSEASSVFRSTFKVAYLDSKSLNTLVDTQLEVKSANVKNVIVDIFFIYKNLVQVQLDSDRNV